MWRDGRLGCYEVICRLLNAYVVEPDDTLFALRKLGPVVAVRNLDPIVMVWLEVSMDNGLGMVRIRFVDMFWRDAGRQHEPRREGERDGRARQRMHDVVIMGHVVAVGQTRSRGRVGERGESVLQNTPPNGGDPGGPRPPDAFRLVASGKPLTLPFSPLSSFPVVASPEASFGR